MHDADLVRERSRQGRVLPKLLCVPIDVVPGVQPVAGGLRQPVSIARNLLRDLRAVRGTRGAVLRAGVRTGAHADDEA